MSVMIKGMEMPTNCNDCPLAGDFKCNLMPSIPALCKEYDMAVQNGKRLNNCPLVEIPPHGRLIDADALYRTIDATSERTIGHTTFKETVLLDIRGMPTILESTIGQLNSDSAVNEANANTSNALNALDCVGESEASR